jgi:cytochrome c biogenesis protein CcmG/thiol:disulfide interchange protein DsbE
VRAGLAAAALLAGIVLAGLGGALGRGGTALEVAGVAPPFAVRTMAGESLSLDMLRGRVVVLNFWASWCAECDLEAADLEAVWREYGARGVTVVGIDYTDTPAAAAAYIERHGITYPNAPDEGAAVSRAYALTGVPETVVIDRAGRVVGLSPGGIAAPIPKLIGPILPSGAFTPADLRAVLDGLTERAG